jgi:hypothetical protein
MLRCTVRELSLLNRGATTTMIDYTQLGISNHTTYARFNYTYINRDKGLPKREQDYAGQPGPVPQLPTLREWNTLTSTSASTSVEYQRPRVQCAFYRSTFIREGITRSAGLTL